MKHSAKSQSHSLLHSIAQDHHHRKLQRQPNIIADEFWRPQETLNNASPLVRAVALVLSAPKSWLFQGFD
jgi:hypothetical protein